MQHAVNSQMVFAWLELDVLGLDDHLSPHC